MPTRYAIDVINFGHYGEPAVFQDLARTAEAAGWDGLFVWDHVAAAWDGGQRAADPWVLLTAGACVTERLRVGTNVTPLPRRRPHILAGQVATLDRLSGGRAVLGVGLGGVPAEYERFGESSDAKRRGEMLDEGLDIVAALWTGEPVTYEGQHFTVGPVRNTLVPVQQPRPPIWVGGDSPPALRRAARWDGWTTGNFSDETGRMTRPPELIAGRIATILELRAPPAEPFDVVVSGYSDASPAGTRMVREYAEAGATWWFEEINGLRGSPDEMLARVKAGPPA